MVNEYKEFHWYNANELDLENIEWDTFRFSQLFELKYNDAKIQIYPYKVLKYMVNHHDLKKYDDRCDGKNYYCTGFHDNGFTPKNVIATCRGNIERLYCLVDTILEYRESQIKARMDEELAVYNYFRKSLDFDFYDFDYASVYVSDVRVMEGEDDILKDALRVFDEFDVKVSYEWDYDAGDEYSRACSLNFKLVKS